jgi:hypothetical protein
MTKNDRPTHEAEFGGGSVKVKVPWQGRAARAEAVAHDTLDKLKSDRDDFKPARIVANIQIVDDEQGGLLTEFDPPFELRVAYTAADFQRAQTKNQNLTLGFWDGGRWIAFTSAKHGFHLEPAAPNRPLNAGGFGVVTLSKWGDPPLGWGP